MVFETVVGVVVGLTLLDEELHTQTWGLAVAAFGLALMVGGLVALARSQAPQRRIHASRNPASYSRRERSGRGITEILFAFSLRHADVR